MTGKRGFCRKRSSMWLSVSFALILILATKVGASTSAVGMKGSYSYVGGKSRDLALSIPGGSPTSPILTPSSPTMPGAASSSLAQTSYYEPRGDSYGGGYGGGGGGGGGWGGGGGSAVYHYMHQPYYHHPAPVYYDDGGGFDGAEKGLIGLLGLTGLKGLLGLLGLAKLLLPLLGLFIPLLLPLLLLKAAALLFLILLIPVPVISTPTGRKFPTTFEEGKAYIKDTIADLLSKIPSDINQIISKIKEPSSLKEPSISSTSTSELRSMPSKMLKMKEVNKALKQRTLTAPQKRVVSTVPVSEGESGSSKSKTSTG